jgi:hypothetical protein
MKSTSIISYFFMSISLTILSSTTVNAMIGQQAFDFFSLNATTTWREYPLNIPQINFLKEKWVWTCSLTLKSKQPVKLNSLVLQWKGEKLHHLAAALYQKKERENAVIPIQQNLVCDGMWDPKTQQMVFEPNEKVIAVNKYYLMVSFPKSMEHSVKKGKFIVLQTQLTSLNQAYSQ